MAVNGISINYKLTSIFFSLITTSINTMQNKENGISDDYAFAMRLQQEIFDEYNGSAVNPGAFQNQNKVGHSSKGILIENFFLTYILRIYIIYNFFLK